MEKDYRKAQEQGYEFHFGWILILITFVVWQMPKGATFPEVDPSELLVARFSTLWNMNDMVKKWQSNIVFHDY
jgi:hypothetical protein